MPHPKTHGNMLCDRLKQNKQTKKPVNLIWNCIYLLGIWYLERRKYSRPFGKYLGKKFHDIPESTAWICHSSQLFPSHLTLYMGFPGGSDSKECACIAGDIVWSVGEEDPLEKEIATHSGILASLVAQTLKRLPAMRETRVPSLGREIPLEKEMATHSSILACNSPWTEEPGRLQSVGSQRVGHDWASSLPGFLPGEFPGQRSLADRVVRLNGVAKSRSRLNN